MISIVHLKSFYYFLILGNCDINDCHANATCTVTDDSYMCNCTKGFHGNGTHCTGIEFFSFYYSVHFVFQVTLFKRIIQTAFLLRSRRLKIMFFPCSSAFYILLVLPQPYKFLNFFEAEWVIICYLDRYFHKYSILQ